MQSLRSAQVPRAGAAVLAGLVLAAALGASAARASFPGRNGLLSVSYGFECPGTRIATLDPRTGRLRMLTPAHCIDWRNDGRASWSPDGRRLIFEYEIPPDQITATDFLRFAIMNADGSARRDIALASAQVITGPSGLPVASFIRSDPSFTADGERLIYTRWVSGPLAPIETWSAALDGSDDRRLAAGQYARMSPDGRRIAYVRTASLAYGDGPPHAVGVATWLMSARTGKPIRELWPAPAGSIDWSPDSRRIVFTATTHPDSVDPANVYVVRTNGTGLKRVTSTRHADETDVVWSPNGRRIAFVREVRRPLTVGYALAQSIWTMRPDGTAQRRVRKPWRGENEDGKGRVRISWQPLPSP